MRKEERRDGGRMVGNLGMTRGLLSGVALLSLLAAQPAPAAESAAQGGHAAQAATRNFEIPAQPLAGALTLFGVQSGLQVTVDTALLSGLHTHGVTGKRSPEEALAALLAGTGMTWRFSGPNTVMVERGGAVNGSSMMLDPVTVTGEKVERSLQETASSVSVISSEELGRKVGAASVADATLDIPNVIYAGTVAAPVIRGQDTQGPNSGSSAFFGGTIPRATVNLDGHYQNFYEYAFGATSIWDVDSVELFRGPQTTSQGANAIAGAIIVNTKDPTFEPEAAYQAEIGNYNRHRTSAMVSGPIAGDQLAGRIAVDYFERDTFIDYVRPGFLKEDTDHEFRSLNARAKLLWVPTHIDGLSAKLTYSHINNNRPTGESASQPYSDLNSMTRTMPSWDQSTDIGVLDVDYDIGTGVRLFNQSQASKTHVDRIAAPMSNGAAIIDQKNFSNESRLNFGDKQSTVSGLAGVYLARTISDDWLYVNGPSDFDDTKNNIGLFSEMSVRLDPQWTLTGGLRFQMDQIRRSGTSNYAAEPLDYNKTFKAVLPKISLAYDVTPDVTVGALVSRGYNPGGINLSFASKKFSTFAPEKVWNYELFSRSRHFDDRLGITSNLFYSDYKNSQRLLPDYLNGIQYGVTVVNAKSAQVYGLEFGADYLVRDDLRLKAGAGLLHSTIDGFTNAAGIAYGERKFGKAPGYTLSIGVDWTVIPDLKLGVESRLTDGYYSTDENNPAYKVDRYSVTNVRISYALRKSLEIYGFANNVFDKRTPVLFSDDRTAGGIVGSMLEPCMFGVGVKGTF